MAMLSEGLLTTLPRMHAGDEGILDAEDYLRSE